MSQVKIYGLRDHLSPIRQPLSDAIHACVVDALQYPPDKRAHRFILLDREDFFFPPDRTERYTIIEFNMFEGRTMDAKKSLMRLLFDRLDRQFGISGTDLEMTIFETPKHNWAFRGKPGDEHTLNYKVEV